MEVLLVTFSSSGGMAQYSAEMANSISEYAEVSVMAPECGEVRDLLNNSVRYCPIKEKYLAVCTAPTLLARVYQRIKAHNPEIVHFPTYGSNFRSILLPPLIRETPIIANLHDPNPHSGMKINLIELLKRASIRYLDRVIVHGPHSASQVTDMNYPEEDIRIIPHGLFTHFIQNQPVTSDQDKVLIFGKIRPNKGYDRLPEIASIVAENILGVEFIVAGSLGKARQLDDKELDKITMGLNSHDNIKFINGYIPTDEVQNYFDEAKVALLPYYDATQSGVALTAYALETPMVATAVGDMSDMIYKDQTGILANPQSSTDIASKIVRLLQDSTLHSELVANIQESQHKYHWENVGQSVFKVYLEVSEQ